MASYNVFDFLKSVPEFDGKAEDLSLFIKYIEEVRQYADTQQLVLFDLKIRHKIVGNANIALINNNNPTRWEEIKYILKTNFCISESIESIVNRIKTAEFRNTIESFYEYIIKLLTNLNLKANVTEELGSWYTCDNNQKMVLKIFINKLPSEPKLILNARNPSTLLQAKEILVETEYFYKNFNVNLEKKKSFIQPPSSTNNSNNNNNRNQNSYYNRENYVPRHLERASSSQTPSSENRSGNNSELNKRFNNVIPNRGELNGNDQIPMEIGILRSSNFHVTAEDLFPI